MNEDAARYRRVADGFTARVRGVPPGRWDDPAPCEGWVARDVVAHLAEWVPAFLGGLWPADLSGVPDPADDPVAAWLGLDAALRAALDDPAVAGAEADTPLGRRTFTAALDEFATDDVLLHTWDLARATGQDEALDPAEVHVAYQRLLPRDALLRASDHFGPAVPPPPGADEQTLLLCFIGRQV